MDRQVRRPAVAAVRLAAEETRPNELGERRGAGGRVQAPEPARLRDGERKAGHLAEFSADALGNHRQSIRNHSRLNGTGELQHGHPPSDVVLVQDIFSEYEHAVAKGMRFLYPLSYD